MRTNDELREKLHELRMLNRSRYEYVLARAKKGCTSKAQAYNDIGLSESWYYKFSEEEREYLEELAMDLRHAPVAKAMMVLEGASELAAQVMAGDLEEKRDSRLRQSAAKDVLDRTGAREPEHKKIDVDHKVHVHGLEEMLNRAYGDS